MLAEQRQNCIRHMTACKCLSNKKEPWSPQAPDNSMTFSWALLPKSLGRVYVQSTWGIDLHLSQLRVPTDPAGCQPWPAAATQGTVSRIVLFDPFYFSEKSHGPVASSVTETSPSVQSSILPASLFIPHSGLNLLPLPGSPTPLLTWGLKILLHLYILPLPPNSSSKPSPSS